jgi:hypothetical protein
MEELEMNNLKMYAFGEDGVATWICATNKNESINIFKMVCGEDCWNDSVEEYENEDDFVREMDLNEEFTYYHDGVTSETDTIRNLINKYCAKPDMFACSEF